MKSQNWNYFLKVVIVVFLGIMSRKITILPLSIGDVLYAVMIYLGVRMLKTKFDQTISAIIASSICFLIEFSQLYQAVWIIEVRRTFLGHYILGQGFLGSDLAAYSAGVLVALFLDEKFSAQNRLSF